MHLQQARGQSTSLVYNSRSRQRRFFPTCSPSSGAFESWYSASVTSMTTYVLQSIDLLISLSFQILKPMLHALLIPGTLSFLSVASNRRLKTAAFRLIGAYANKAKSLQFLDLSQNILDKKSVEYIVAALETAPEPGLVSLRLDDCGLRPAALEALCMSILLLCKTR